MSQNNSVTPAEPDPREQLTRRAIIVWLSALFFYIFAVTGRSSFGVASVDAIDRFDIDASRVAVFTAVQLGVYAVAQIPTGLLIDRFGARRILIIGALIMAVGQITLGLTTNYWVAIGARVLIGAGDATAFLSVMRILPFWFPLRLTPLFTQLTTSGGQLGQILSAVPFLAVLNNYGWVVAFVSLGSLGILIAILGGVALAEPPTQTESTTPAHPAGDAFWPRLRYVLTHPACWLAFFIHAATMSNFLTFTLLWAAPLVTLGMGLGPERVAQVLTINTVMVIIAAPIMGVVSARTGPRRVYVAWFSSLAMALTWFLFFLPTEPRGFGALVIVACLLAVFNSTSNYGFDVIRETLPREVVATGTGLGNMGGFIMGMIAAQGVGWLLDASAGSASYQWADFRIGWIAVYAVWAVSALGAVVAKILLNRRSSKP